MPIRILLLSVLFLLSTTISGQKKPKTARVLKVVHPAGKVSPTRISEDRTLRLIQREDAQKSLVVLKNKDQMLPLSRLDTLKILVVSIGMNKVNPMPQMVGRYVKATYVNVSSNTKIESIRPNLWKSDTHNLVLLVVGKLSPEEDAKQLISDCSENCKSVILLLGTSSILTHWTNQKCAALVVASGENYDNLDLSAQLLFGAIKCEGKLPSDLDQYHKGYGISVAAIDRLSYILPEEIGIDSLKLSQKMDSLVEIGLKAKAYPGCQMLLAKQGKVFYQKSYGFHTYDQSLPVQLDDVYDLASVTKVLAPVPALMMLADQKKFLVTKKMSDYWPDWKGSNKEGILVSDVLSHQARLQPGVVLWPKTMTGQGLYKPEYYASQHIPGFDLRVSNGLFLIDSYPDTVYKVIRDSPLLKSKRYAYSDLGFVVLPKVIENLSGLTFETFLQQKLYARLGASTLRYNPYQVEPMDKIVPTENDHSFRHELLQGFVHDETAALLGGISGNAGLFGCAGDVAKVMQLYLQNGAYGNERYISSETLKNWTSSHFQKTNNRRGFGFDKPGIQVNKHTGKERYPSAIVSEQSYGHSGYTGTFVWADPVNELLFVFLSNRVFPDRENHRINKLRLRPLLLETMFKLAGVTSGTH